MMIQNYENSQSKSPYKLSRSEVLSLVRRFVNITRREWIILNEARNLDQLDNTYLGLPSALTLVPEMGPAIND